MEYIWEYLGGYLGKLEFAPGDSNFSLLGSPRPAHIKYGMFCALSSLTGIESTIEALKYLFDNLKADGITLFKSYDSKYLSYKDFGPIWAQLDKRQAVIFSAGIRFENY